MGKLNTKRLQYANYFKPKLISFIQLQDSQQQLLLKQQLILLICFYSNFLSQDLQENKIIPKAIRICLQSLHYFQIQNSISFLSLLSYNLYLMNPQSDQKLESIETHLTAEFKKMKEYLFTLFQATEKQVAMLYQLVLREIASIALSLRQSNSSTEILTEITSINKQSQWVIPKLGDRLAYAILTPTILKRMKICSKKDSETTIGTKNKNGHKRTKSNSSQSNRNLNKTATLQQIQNRLARRITKNSIRQTSDLRFLEGTWPNLQAIILQSNGIIKLAPFEQIKADSLKILNLSKNYIQNLKAFKGAYLPELQTLNLSGNKIKQIEGLDQAILPRLKTLDLSKNQLSNLGGLSKCDFSELFELHLEGNKINGLEELKDCTFPNLQILTLDNNRLVDLAPLSQITFYKLKCLSFSKNSVASLQFLQKISLKKLQGLIANHNKIKQLDPLTKAELPILRQIILNNNEIDDLNCIQRMEYPHLAQFDLENNKIKPISILCLLINDKGQRQAKKKFPFVLI